MWSCQNLLWKLKCTISTFLIFHSALFSIVKHKLVKHKMPCKIMLGIQPYFPQLLFCYLYFTMIFAINTKHTGLLFPGFACLRSSLTHNFLLVQKDFMDVILFVHIHLLSLCLIISPWMKYHIFLFVFSESLVYHLYVIRISINSVQFFEGLPFFHVLNVEEKIVSY
jgi:hypothetical protein